MKTYNHAIKRFQSGAYLLSWSLVEGKNGQVPAEAMRQVVVDRPVAERFAAERGITMPEEPPGCFAPAQGPGAPSVTLATAR